MFKFRINDTVIITSGKDKNQTGKITSVNPVDNMVLVEGKNTYKRHIKPQGNKEGQVVELSRPLNVAKVQLICPSCNKPTRVGFDGEGKNKARICKKCRAVISVETKK